MKETTGAKIMNSKDISVIVIKDGEARMLHDLPGGLMRELVAVYDREPVVGISRECYSAMTKLLAKQLEQYQEFLIDSKEDLDFFNNAVAFAKACNIYSNESPLLFDLLCWVDRVVADKKATTKSINCRNAIAYLNYRHPGTYKYSDVAREFRKLKKALFGDNMRVGFVKFMKLYFSAVELCEA